MKLAAALVTVLVCMTQQEPSPKRADFVKIEGIVEMASIELAADHNLNLEPGVRATRQDNSFTLSSYDGSKVRVRVGEESFSLLSGTVARLTPKGWDFGTNKFYATTSVTASRAEQDDTDTNLKSMQESAKKLKTKNNTNQDASQQPGKKLKYRLLFAENPNPTAELFSKQAIQQLTHLSPIGF